MTEFHDHTTYNCDSISFGLVKICLWILVGLIISFNVPKVYEKFSSQKHEIIQEAPCAQQTQLLQQSQSSSRSTGKWRKKMFIVFVLAGVVFSIWLFLYLREDIVLRRKETLGSMCDERARMLQDQFNVSMNHVHALALLVSTFHHGKQPSAIDQVDSYAYLPPNSKHSLNSDASATLVVFERRYAYLENHIVEQIVGSTDKQPLLETPGEVFELRKLLPTSLHYDFNIHIMDFQPGEFLNVKEVHYNQHGLLLLEGQGIYRLRDSWYPVQAGDTIWMAPFVPQWYAALGKTKSRYLLYKDVNRNPL
ncbi:(S)-ureidoglycine aminohydrolase [Olea europaea subsp. europaea]|uniref:(S)-ureidoglycine aminohydrolase n=1 Tax=Olea europaea subsp. europaea TaxID=158383 RepID=A0A8S0VJA0_OLEEU|nr:(S)-ureidoglycine aminohydrolase [Olea europaea subsp. europaea]